MRKLMINKNKIAIISLLFLGISFVVAGVLLTGKYINENSEKELTKKDYNKYYSEVYSESLYFDFYLIDQYPIKDINTLSDLNKTYLALKLICPYTNYTVTSEAVEKELSKHFIDYRLYKKNIKINETLHYRFKDDIYTFSSDSMKKYGVVTKEISAKGTDKSFTIKKKVYYTKMILKDNKYFNVVYATNKLKKILYQNTSDEAVLSDEEFEKIKNDLTTLIYKFEKIDNHYYLKSITSSNEL